MSTFNNHVLPTGWAMARLPDLIGVRGLLTDGDWVESKDQDPNGSIRLTQLADVGDGYFRDRSDRFMTDEKARLLSCTFLEPGDILVARMPDPLGRACIFPPVQQTCVTVVDVCVLRPGSDKVDTHWLMNFINAPDFRVAVSGLQAGSTRKRISKANLCTIDLPVPPAAEQRRIVEAIESHLTRLDDAVSTLERVERNLKRYRASVLKSAVEGQLVPTEAALAKQEGRTYEPASVLLERILTERRRRWPESGKKGKYQEPTPPDTTNLPSLPEGWCWTTVDYMCSHIVDCPHSTPEWTEAGRICVRTTEFLPGRLIMTSARFVSSATYEERTQRLRPEPGDILYSREGGILGIACRVPPGVELCLGQRMMLMRTVSPAYSRYLMHVLNSPVVMSRVRELTGGSASPHLNVGSVRNFKIPLPPEPEAIRIADSIDDVFSTIDATDSSISANLTRSRRLRHAVLKWAFEGKLADQDPTDEPASVLLERIKAERDTAKPAKTAALQRKAAKKKARA